MFPLDLLETGFSFTVEGLGNSYSGVCAQVHYLRFPRDQVLDYLFHYLELEGCSVHLVVCFVHERGSDLSDADGDSMNGSDHYSNPDQNSESFNDARTNMYRSSLDPKLPVSDHDSDSSECSMNTEYDTDPEDATLIVAAVPLVNNCSCEKCPESEKGYCCNGIEAVSGILEKEDSTSCITRSVKFTNCILNSDVLQLIEYSTDRLKIHDKDTETQRRLFRHTAYRCFLALLELHGLGKGNRYELPACVVKEIRNKYPSLNGQYTGFKTGDSSTHATLSTF